MQQAFGRDFVEADKTILLTIIAFSLCAAFLTSLQNGYFLLGIVGGGLVATIAMAAYFLLRGELLSRLIMATCLVSLMAISIQQANGLGEGHFIFFIAMTVLIRYRDMLPLIWAAVLTVTHHLSFSYCQANGVAMFGEPVTIFTWQANSELGIWAPLIYHMLIATAAILISAYYIYGNIQKFTQDALVTTTTERAARGDLSARANSESTNPIIDITNQFIGEIESLTTACGELSDKLSSQSDRLVSSATMRLQKAEEQQNMISLIASSVEEMSATTAEIASNVENTVDVAGNTSQNSQTGTSTTQECGKSLNSLTTEVHSASERINDLNEKGKQISSIVETIRGIAEQTNLLALNAAIEAARAGEQGRGFAVVADEVRFLSQRTHESTEEITSMIESFSNTTDDAVKVMERCMNYAKTSVEDFSQVNSLFANIANAVEDISQLTGNVSSAAEAQKNVVKQINEKTSLTHEASQEFTMHFTEVVSEAGNLREQSERLSALISRYR